MIDIAAPQTDPTRPELAQVKDRLDWTADLSWVTAYTSVAVGAGHYLAIDTALGELRLTYHRTPSAADVMAIDMLAEVAASYQQRCRVFAEPGDEYSLEPASADGSVGSHAWAVLQIPCDEARTNIVSVCLPGVGLVEMLQVSTGLITVTLQPAGVDLTDAERHAVLRIARAIDEVHDRVHNLAGPAAAG